MTLEGAVEAVNDRGIKLEGEWLNRSKFGPHLELPEVGCHVRADIDSRGYIKSLEVLEPSQGVRTRSRDETIARLTVLEAAASFAAGRDDIKSDDVLRIADRWLAWLER